MTAISQSEALLPTDLSICQSDGCALDEERLRLAQEVHDIVGHGLATIQLQASISRHLWQSRPEQAPTALDDISRTAGDALAELRAALATLTPHARVGVASHVLVPGLHLLEKLRQRMEGAGVAVDVSVRGVRRALPAGADQAAYRVLQEALTNVIKHSSHPHARIVIAYLPAAVSIRVSNQDAVWRHDRRGIRHRGHATQGGTPGRGAHRRSRPRRTVRGPRHNPYHRMHLSDRRLTRPRQLPPGRG